MHPILAALADGAGLPYDTAVRAFQVIMNGGATPAQMGAFLIALRQKGETVDEIAAGAYAMRVKAQKFSAPEGSIDTCGTGGDARGTYNISTAVAFVLAACGLPVAKHGNRSVSSQSGSADVLAALGVKVDMETAVAERCLRETGMTFILATRYHTAMRHVAPVRQELAMRTIFNLLGPVSNPAAPHFQLLGVYSPDWLEPMARVLRQLGTKAAWVVHGDGGLDELSLSGASRVVELRGQEIRSFSVSPEDAGLPQASLEEIRGRDPLYNATALVEAISGVRSAYRNAVLLNAAAGLVVAGRAADLKEAAAQAAQAIDSGLAHGTLKKFVDMSNTKP